ATGVPVVVVLVQGRPHALPDLTGRAAAVLSAWYPGPWGGQAVADILLGTAEPTGRLPVSVPRTAAQLPVFYNGKDHGYRGYVDQPATARHPFGHGLSYTTVEYGRPRLTRPVATLAEFDKADETGGEPSLVCSVEVRNTGDRPVRETVQLYVRRVLGGTSWPRVRELRGFRHTQLAPGETSEVSFTVDARTLASVSRSGKRQVEAGEFAIETGPSSARTQAAPLTVHDERGAASPGP
ncbi:glycoside hydrolase family 3 C-terminal domain-containing protein, partial [Streptomyces albidoflavus]